MKKIAITGSVACGKTTLLKILAKSFPVFNCDDAIHEIYSNPQNHQKVISQIEEKILHGAFSKAALVRNIMDDKSILKKLEGILYPELHKKMAEFERTARRKSSIAFFEVPLMLEKNLWKKYDNSIVIISTKFRRHKNFINRGGSSTMFRFINSLQWSDEKKRVFTGNMKKNFTLLSACNIKMKSQRITAGCTHI